MKPNSIRYTVVCIFAWACFAVFVTSVQAQDKPIKVFVLVGQSNMQGHAKISTLPHLRMDPATRPILDEILDQSGHPKPVKDVHISYVSKHSTKGLMGAGFGADKSKFGPELTFAAYMKKHLGEPILIIKAAWGGKSLHTDFRPPSAGPYVFPQAVLDRLKKQGKDIAEVKAARTAATGVYYKKTIDHVQAVLSDIDSTIVGYDEKRGYELAGLVWFQGWNDMVDQGVYPNRAKPGGYNDYTKVLRHLIRDFRKDLKAPKLPIVVGVMGVGGPTDKYGPDQQRYKATHQNFRDAMAAPAKEEEFKGNVFNVLTEDCWDMELSALVDKKNKLRSKLSKLQKAGTLTKENSKKEFEKQYLETFTEKEREILEVGVSNQAYHYLGSGKIMAQIGKRFAEAFCQQDGKKKVAPKAATDSKVRVFIFAGQSNMVGADSKVDDIKNFPPYVGLDQPQDKVQFSYCLGRENKTQSNGWTELQPLKNMVGPELSFARKVSKQTKDKIAIIKIAAGGTHLGGDWNPDNPEGFKLYPLALKTVKDSLAALEKDGHKYQIDGFMWHQGENDMFNEEYMANYGANLKNFVAKWRTDLDCPDLKFFIGELCTKTIWGMDLRPRMYKISVGQKEVANADPNAFYVPTSHVGVEIGGGVGLHYHYGTLGQLEHGENYADAWLNSAGLMENPKPKSIKNWPYANGDVVKLFVLAGHRNMEGERAFVQELTEEKDKELLKPNDQIPFKYSLGGGYKVSDGWEPLAPAGFYDTFGPELSFGAWMKGRLKNENIAIAKFTHSGSQIIDWSPKGSVAKTRNLYPDFVKFIKESVSDLEGKGHKVVVGGIFYHVGENDMSFGPFRKNAATHVASMIKQARIDLDMPDLQWFISQQPPTDDKSVNQIDVVKDFVDLAESDPNVYHTKAFDPLGREKQLVISTSGIVRLGWRMANIYLKYQK